jgi:glutamate-1-semialdehyde 2,1-aminomutase
MKNKIEFNENYPVIENSIALLNRAEGLIPGFTQTLAKGPSQYVKGVAPIYLKSGKGSHVIDVDGNEFLDYTMGVGPLSLGYSYDVVNDAIKAQLEDGITFSLMHPLEVEVAELIKEHVPNAESVRFSKTGCDVTSAAVRLARAHTGRNTVLCCGYHGWHDWYISVTDRAAGIPEMIKNLTYTFNYNDIDSVLDSIDRDTAAIILEPVVFEEPRKHFLQRLRDICDAKGIVLIFDEMWTGFRMALGGAQEYFGVDADLVTFSKAVANGMPLSILAGRHDIMRKLDKDVFFYTTFGGEALSLAAAKATITEMQDKNVIKHLWEKGEILKKGYNDIAKEMKLEFTRAIGYPCRTMVAFNSQDVDNMMIKSFVQQELVKRGILWTGFHNMSYSHSKEDIAYTLQAYYVVLKLLRDALDNNNLSDLLLGEPVQTVFRKVGNFNMKPKQ